VLASLFWMTFRCRPILEVLSWQSCSTCPSSSCPVTAVFSFLSSLSCPLLCPALPGVLSWQPCPGSPVLPVLFCQSHHACSFLPVQFYLSSSDCPVLSVLFCLSCSSCPVCVSCTACSLLAVLSFLFRTAGLTKQSCAGSHTMASLSWPFCSSVLEVLS
jgi:hypothetical protein